MLTIPGYTTTEQLYESGHSLIFRGRRNADNLPIILKLLKNEYPTRGCFQHQFWTLSAYYSQSHTTIDYYRPDQATQCSCLFTFYPFILSRKTNHPCQWAACSIYPGYWLFPVNPPEEVSFIKGRFLRNGLTCKYPWNAPKFLIFAADRRIRPWCFHGSNNIKIHGHVRS